VALEQHHLFLAVVLLTPLAAALEEITIAALRQERLPLAAVEMEAQLLTVLLLPLILGVEVVVVDITTALTQLAVTAAPVLSSSRCTTNESLPVSRN
jgi:biotin transporter BioY